MAIIEARLFGKLLTLAGTMGIKCPLAFEAPEEGIAAAELLLRAGLPVEAAEGVFVNHKMHPLSHVLKPGDLVAFVSKGVPGPHRYTLGIYGAGKGIDSGGGCRKT